MQLTFHILVISLLILLSYTWVVYPFLIKTLALKKNKSTENTENKPLPDITVILSAYNEESVIKTRLTNLMNIDYPSQKMRVLIGTDGSTDKTAAIAHAFAEKHINVELHEFNTNRGKVAVLRDLVNRWKSKDRKDEELLVFTDANTNFQPDAVRKLVRHFDNPHIGGVCGQLKLTGNKPEGAYWRWETKLKTYESAIDSCLGANGSIYAIRPDLFWKDIPENTVVDDFVIGLKVREQGFQFIYDPEAIGTENLPETSDEWSRRVRIGSGDYQALFLCKECLRPSRGKFAWMLWSHKVFRWFTPHFISTLIFFCITNTAWQIKCSSPVCIVENIISIEFIILIAFSLFLFLSLVGRIARKTTGIILAIPRLCDHFTTMQAALFAGFIRFSKGGLSGSWARTPRETSQRI